MPTPLPAHNSTNTFAAIPAPAFVLACVTVQECSGSARARASYPPFLRSTSRAFLPSFPSPAQTLFFFFFHAETLPESMLSSLLPPFMHRAPIIGTLPANRTPPPHHHHLSPRGTRLARASPMPAKQKHGEIRLPQKNGNTPFPHCMAARFRGRKGEGKGGHLLVITGKINGKKGPEESGREGVGGGAASTAGGGHREQKPRLHRSSQRLAGSPQGAAATGNPPPTSPRYGGWRRRTGGDGKRGLGRGKGQKSPEGTPSASNRRPGTVALPPGRALR